LRAHIADLAKVGWDQLRGDTYRDQLDERKRDALLHHYRNLLTRFGDIVGGVRHLMEMVRGRVLELGRRGYYPQGPAPTLEEPPEQETIIVRRSVHR